jgi:hypothetical protein
MGNISEIDGMYNTALRKHKKATPWGLSIISQCGISYTADKATQERLTNDAKEEIKSIVENAITLPNLCKYDAEISLSEKQYLGDVSDELLRHLKPGMANLITAAPGIGKTEWVKKMVKEGKKILLVFPYRSVIMAKFEKDAEICALFDIYKENVSISTLKEDRSAVMTIDKFAQIAKTSNWLSTVFDLIVIDESHLIFTSGYRLERMADALTRIKECINASINVDAPTRLLLMTGTPTGELDYFDTYKVLNHIHVTKPEQRTKQAEIILCNNQDDMKVVVAQQIADYIKEGKKVLYPNNDGDVNVAYIVGAVKGLLGRDVKYGYYKKAREKDEIVQSINRDKTVGNKELIFATNYLSVGIDINDLSDFVFVYDSSFTGSEIEQFNCRLRNQDIDSKIYIAINNGEGIPNQNLFNITPLSLYLNDEDMRQSQDYIAIADKKIKFSCDPVTNEIQTPGFRSEYGRSKFVLEEHELYYYEKGYSSTMCTPFFVTRSLVSYGYKVSVSDSPLDQMSEDGKKEMYEAAKEARKAESAFKNRQSMNTFWWFLGYEGKEGVTNDNRVGYIIVNRKDIKITEDYNLPTVRITATDENGHITELEVPNLKVFEDHLKNAREFLSWYSKETAKWLFEQCVKKKKKGEEEVEEKRLNISELHRYVALIEYIKEAEKKNIGIDFATVLIYIDRIIEEFYEDMHYSITKEKYEEYIEECVDLYLNKLGRAKCCAKSTRKTYRKNIEELFETVAIKSTSDKEIRLKRRPLPERNSELYLRDKEMEKIIKKFFLPFAQIVQNDVNDIQDQPLLGGHIGDQGNTEKQEDPFIITEEGIIADKNHLLKIQNKQKNLMLREMIVQTVGENWYVDVRPQVILLAFSAGVSMIAIDCRGMPHLEPVGDSSVQILCDTHSLTMNRELWQKIEIWAVENVHNYFITSCHLYLQILKDNNKGSRKIWKFERYVDENTTSTIEAKKDRDTFGIRETFFHNKKAIYTVEFSTTMNKKRWSCGELAQYCVDNGYFFIENDEIDVCDVQEAQIQVANATVLKNLSIGASKLSNFLGRLLILI